MRHIRLVVEYDGSHLHGWQRQDNAPTVQQHLEEALAKLLTHDVQVVGASRTDAGVHATIEDLARAKQLPPSYVSGILRLTLLAPEIVEAILDGRQSVALQLDDLLAGFPLEWEGQRWLGSSVPKPER